MLLDNSRGHLIQGRVDRIASVTLANGTPSEIKGQRGGGRQTGERSASFVPIVGGGVDFSVALEVFGGAGRKSLVECVLDSLGITFGRGKGIEICPGCIPLHTTDKGGVGGGLG